MGLDFLQSHLSSLSSFLFHFDKLFYNQWMLLFRKTFNCIRAFLSHSLMILGDSSCLMQRLLYGPFWLVLEPFLSIIFRLTPLIIGFFSLLFLF
jgi:hypothetical protein